MTRHRSIRLDCAALIACAFPPLAAFAAAPADLQAAYGAEADECTVHVTC